MIHYSLAVKHRIFISITHILFNKQINNRTTSHFLSSTDSLPTHPPPLSVLFDTPKPPPRPPTPAKRAATNPAWTSPSPQTFHWVLRASFLDTKCPSAHQSLQLRIQSITYTSFRTESLKTYRKTWYMWRSWRSLRRWPPRRSQSCGMTLRIRWSFDEWRKKRPAPFPRNNIRMCRLETGRRIWCSLRPRSCSPSWILDEESIKIRTMVVHFHNAPSTLTTMVRARWLKLVAFHTHIEPLFIGRRRQRKSVMRNGARVSENTANMRPFGHNSKDYEPNMQKAA